MAARSSVTTYVAGGQSSGTVALPQVFLSPIRPDLISDVHTRLSKNSRQPYAVSKSAGHQTSAESWGTGRAVARIPRVPGGGTHRAGQGAFGNMCRGGRMFAPTKTWRRWHRKVNLTQKRYAVVSALAASAIPSLVFARGHKIEQVPEIPLVIDNKSTDGVVKTSAAVKLLQSLGAFTDVERVKDNVSVRPGKGKNRNRRWIVKKGPLLIYSDKSTLSKAFRNLPGVDTMNVGNLNLLKLAPGGHLGRFIIWTKDAFQRLDSLYGTYKRPAVERVNYRLPLPILSNPDVSRIINSTEVKSLLRPKNNRRVPRFTRKNPLRNMAFMNRLNPYAITQRRRAILTEKKRAEKKAALIEAKRKGTAPKPTKKGPSLTKLKKKRSTVRVL